MPDDDAEAREEDHEVEPPSRSPVDEVAAAVVERFPGTRRTSSRTASRWCTSTGRRVARRRRVPARRAAVHAVRRRHRGRPPRRVEARAVPAGVDRRALRGGGQLPLARAQPPHPRRSREVPADDADDRQPRRPLPGRELPRARGLRPLRHRVHRPSRPHAHPHARRLGRPPAAQGRRTRRACPSRSRATRARDERAAEGRGRRAGRGRRRRSARARRARVRPRGAPARGADRRGRRSSCVR